jgi:ubiquinone/menaquinone biosynthesis C-methylase UbiE
MSPQNEYWNTIFSTNADSQLGWYEQDASQTLKFLEQIAQAKPATIFLAGAGTSTLVDVLLVREHQLVLNDISDEALNKLKIRHAQNQDLIWLHADISKPISREIPLVDIWIDRAVLHFLLEETDIQGYFKNLQSTIKPGGYALLAEFSTAGAQKCAGLEVRRYSLEEMTRRMDSGFQLVKHEEYAYINPSGDPRPYIYALYKKQDTPRLL